MVVQIYVVACRHLGNAGEPAVHLLGRLLAFDPSRRCSAEEALAHEYLHSFEAIDLQFGEPYLHSFVPIGLQLSEPMPMSTCAGLQPYTGFTVFIFLDGSCMSSCLCTCTCMEAVSLDMPSSMSHCFECIYMCGSCQPQRTAPAWLPAAPV